ncbi:MAG: tetratricopeptide repeat protein [Steroidobacteraceae bacterium]|nr:tetratricopeptide repeat protein [Steroidobacteraceae bacterium]
MDDYLSESEQWEFVKRWMRENAVWIVGGVVLGVLALAGWRIWQERTERLAQEASGRYEQAIEAFGRNDRARGFTLVDELRRDHRNSPYADQADLLAARVQVDTREFDKAAERLKRVMDVSRDAELAIVARGRLARVYLEQDKPDEALALLKSGKDGAFEPRFEEIRGDALLAKGDRSGALTAYRAARAGAAGGAVDAGLLELKIIALEPAKVN